MKVYKDYPALTQLEHDVERVTVNLDTNKAYCEIHSQGGRHTVVEVDIKALFIKYSVTPTQKNTIRGFFRYVVAEAMAIEESQLPDPLPE